ncbi:MAG: GNAT family N-acetyltransferase [Actinomycetota bacterium]
MPGLNIPDPFSDGVVALRRWEQNDIASLVELVADPEVPRWTGIPSPYTRRDAKGFLRTTARAEAMSIGTDLCVYDAGGGEIFGGAGLKLHVIHATAEVGYWVARNARRRGIASRAVHLMAGWAFGELGVRRLELLTHPGNRASEAVALRCGFEREGVLRSYREIKGRRVDLTMFSLLPEDARAAVRGPGNRSQ